MSCPRTMSCLAVRGKEADGGEDGNAAGTNRGKARVRSLLMKYMLFKSLGPGKYHVSHLHDTHRWKTISEAAGLTFREETSSEKGSYCVVDIGAGWGRASVAVAKAIRNLADSSNRGLTRNVEIVKIEPSTPVSNAARNFFARQTVLQNEGADIVARVCTSIAEIEGNAANIVLCDIMEPCLLARTQAAGLLGGGPAFALRECGKRGLVGPDTMFLPHSAQVWGMLVHAVPEPCVPAVSFPLPGSINGLDLRHFNKFRQPNRGYDCARLSALKHAKLTKPFRIDTISFRELCQCETEEELKVLSGLKSRISVQIEASGVCNALVVWHDLHYHAGPGGIISSAPGNSQARRQAIYVLDPGKNRQVMTGESLEFAILRDDEMHINGFQFSQVIARNDITSGHDDAGGREFATVSRWHFAMLHDYDRNTKYQLAIQRALAKMKGSHVLDIGTGTGLLACFAARAGAGRVTACEANSSIARAAEQIVAANGLAESICIVSKHSTDLVPGSDDYPSKADLLVSEIVDCGLLGEDVLPTVSHARQNLLKDDALVIPSHATVWAVLVDLSGSGRIPISRPLPAHLYQNSAVGEDDDQPPFTQFLRRGTWEQIRLKDVRHQQITRAFECFKCDLSSGSQKKHSYDLQIECVRPGRATGVAMWFDLALDKEETVLISTGPSNPSSCWSQCVQVLDSCLDGREFNFSAGDVVKLRAIQDLHRIKFKIRGVVRAKSH